MFQVGSEKLKCFMRSRKCSWSRSIATNSLVFYYMKGLHNGTCFLPVVSYFWAILHVKPMSCIHHDTTVQKLRVNFNDSPSDIQSLRGGQVKTVTYTGKEQNRVKDILQWIEIPEHLAYPRKEVAVKH